MADWADRQAAEIIQHVYAHTNARDLIAAELRNVALSGVRVGIRQATQIMNDEAAGRPLAVSEIISRAVNACGQI